MSAASCASSAPPRAALPRPLADAGVVEGDNLGADVEELPDHDVAAHLLAQTLRGDGGAEAVLRGLEELLAQRQTDVADDDRGRDPEGLAVALVAERGMEGLEPAMQGRSPAAGVRMIDDVVVDEGRGVEELEGSGCLGEPGARLGPRGQLAAGGQLEAPPQEDGSDPLAAAGVGDERVTDLGGVRGDGRELGGLRSEEAFDSGGRLGGDVSGSVEGLDAVG